MTSTIDPSINNTYSMKLKCKEIKNVAMREREEINRGVSKG